MELGATFNGKTEGMSDNTLDTTVDEWRAELERITKKPVVFKQEKLLAFIGRRGSVTVRDVHRGLRPYKEGTSEAIEIALRKLTKNGILAMKFHSPANGRPFYSYKLTQEEKKR